MGLSVSNAISRNVKLGNSTVIPISPTYTWTTTDSFTDGGLMVLSNGNQRITYTPNAIGHSGWFRTATPITGKTYCEFQVIQRGALLPNAFGVTTVPSNVFYNAGSASMFAGNGGCGLSANGYYNNGVPTTSASYNFVQGNRIGVAFDTVSKKLWFSKNGTWISGDPATGTSPTMTLAFGLTFYFYFSAYTCSISSGTFIYEIYPNTSYQLYPVPAGFSPYQP